MNDEQRGRWGKKLQLYCDHFSCDQISCDHFSSGALNDHKKSPKFDLGFDFLTDHLDKKKFAFVR
jgi:hypothetical protein